MKAKREQAANYRAEIEQRLGCRPALFEMAALGTSFDDRRPYEVAEGVAIIRISGALVNDAWWCDETEYAEIQSEVKMAVEDAEVSAILLHVNSPGGETDNAFETAKVLAEAKKKKPMWAVADNMAYSAGYLLASVADRLYVPEMTGGVGSIGVYAAHFDYSKLLEKQGVGVTLISAGKGKTDGSPYQPLSETARKRIAAEVDRLYGLFVGSVAKHRKISEESIRTMGAALFHGSESAIAAGLADKAGTVTDAWVALAEHARKKSAFLSSMSASAGMQIRKEGSQMEPNTQPADASQMPEQAAAATAKAIADAKASGLAEAQEIAELCALAGQETKAGAFIADVASGKKTVASVRKDLLEAKAKAGEEGGEVSTAAFASTAASKEPTKPAQSLSERMKAKFQKGA